MSQRKLYPTLIGVFVLLAAGLLVASILLVARSERFRQRVPFVACFDSSVAGLRTGALVTYRGVSVGEVTRINVRLNHTNNAPLIPVHFDLDPARFKHTGDPREATDEEVPGRFKLMIDKGLRARLKLDNYLTGQLSVELDFLPESEVVYRKPFSHPHRQSVPEFPTAPGDFEALMGQLKQLPVQELFTKLDRLVTGLDKLVNDEDSKKILANIRKTTDELPKTIETFRGEIKPLMDTAKSTLAGLGQTFIQASATLKQIQTLAEKITDSADPALKLYKDTMTQAQESLAQAKETIKTFEGAIKNADKTLLSDKSKLQTELVTTLKDLQKTIRNVNVFVEYLQSHPEALLKGKKGK